MWTEANVFRHSFFFTIIFALITEPSCNFSKLKTVIICNKAYPMFKTLHIAFISLKKPCICRSIGSKYSFIMKYHRNITLDHPHTRYSQFHCVAVSTIIKYSCSKHMMQLSLWFYTFIHHCNRRERKVQTLEFENYLRNNHHNRFLKKL